MTTIKGRTGFFINIALGVAFILITAPGANWADDKKPALGENPRVPKLRHPIKRTRNAKPSDKEVLTTKELENSSSEDKGKLAQADKRKKTQSKKAKTSDTKTKAEPKSGNDPKPKAGAAADEGDDSPWSRVDLPDEMSIGIDYKKPPRSMKISFNLVDVDLMQLIKMIGNITGKAFILGGKTPNIKATIYAPTPVSANEVYQAFLSVLQVNGLTVVPAGRYLKILPIGGPTSQNLRIIGERNAPPGDEIVTRLHPLEHVAAEDLAELLGRFKSSDGDVTVYGPTNTLIITDYGSSIRRLIKLIDMLDTPETGEQIWIEAINYADASEMADRIMEIFEVDASASKTTSAPAKTRKGKKGRKQPTNTATMVGQQGGETKLTKILSDERTNSLIIVASESAYLRVLELIKRLDVPIPGEGTLHVHKLQHADATELAKTLSNLSKGAKSASKSKKKGSDTTASIFEGQVEISADKATNSLVIVSSLRDYMSLKQVIEKLDVMLRQVYVEAVIMEVSLDKNRDLGLGFHVGNTIDTRGDTSLIYGSSQPNDQLNSLLLGPGAMSGLAAGIRGPELEGTEDLLGVGISIPAFGVALQALQTNSDVNVLSTPHILATDNVEASITVGENVPVQQGYNPMGSLISQMASNATGAAGSAMSSMMGGYGGFGFGGFSISRQNVGLTLGITPHINDDNQVRLEITLEISEVKSADSNLGPNISKKDAKTTSVVADQQTIVIGGLITDNEIETTQKVPVLGDIPILGFFFRHKSSLIRKRNLLIFLTPYIIRNADDFREIFNRKMAERREFIERWTAFEYHRVDPHLDWSRTNGALSEINLIVRSAEEDEELRRKSEQTNAVEHTPKDPIIFPSDRESGDDEGDEGPSDNSTPNVIVEPLTFNEETGQ